MNHEINFCCDQTYLGKLRNSYTYNLCIASSTIRQRYQMQQEKKKDLGESPIQ